MILVAIYLLVAVVLLSLKSSFGTERLRRKRMVIAVLSFMDIALFLLLYLYYREPIIQIGTGFSAVVFCSALYSLIRDKKRPQKEYFFVLQPGTYTVEGAVKMDVVPKPIMKSVKRILWDGKQIVCRQHFPAKAKSWR